MAKATEKTQSDKFKDAARELKTDKSVRRWEERLRKVAKQKESGEGNSGR